MHPSLFLPAAGAALLIFCALPVQAQDVELLGEVHGVRPPPGYYETLRRDPGAFQFGRAWRARLGLGVAEGDGGAQGGGGGAGAPDGGAPRALNMTSPILAANTGLGRRDAPVRGTFTFPLLLGRFADTDVTRYGRDDVQREFFDGPTSSSLRKTIPEYYSEISMGHVELVGETFDWAGSTRTRAEVTGTSSGLGGDAEVGEFIMELAAAADGADVDWGRFDNDGPDGIPNSGDDDGHVDILAVMHPTEGAECGKAGSSTKIWSHRWRLREATGEAYVTSSPAGSADRDFILIDDYVILPLLECDWEDGDDLDINQIGVFAHELGHGFGLPDLYGTGSSKHYGAGNWDVMGTGSWGCSGYEAGGGASRPCHPGAWTKHAMGWVEVDTVPAGAALREVTLQAVETSGRIVLVETNDASGEYFLLEYRERVGFDQDLPEEGLLIWHVDPGVLSSSWAGNGVNADPDHPGVWLRQADGLNELMKPGGGRGDAGDVFTGTEGENAFHAGTVPSAFTHAGAASGLTLTEVRGGTSALAFDLENGYRTVTLETEGGGSASSEFVVDGAAVSGAPRQFLSAPFQSHEIQPPPGTLLEEGIREGFLGWEDGSPRIRTFVGTRSDSVLIASYGGRELHFDVAMKSPSESVEPGILTLVPGTADGWVPEGVEVVVEVAARTGFEFLGWEGAFAGRSSSFVTAATEPLQADALFDLTYSVASNPIGVVLVAAREHELSLRVANGNEPVTWSVVQGSLAHGLTLQPEGRMLGAPLEEGTFPVRLRARDAIGLEADLELEIEVGPPSLGIETLVSPFLGSGSTGQGPTGTEQAYLDWSGNRSGGYDVGDFRAFLQAHPDTPESTPVAASADGEIIVLPAVRLEEPESGASSGGGAMEGDAAGGGGGVTDPSAGTSEEGAAGTEGRLPDGESSGGGS